MTTFRVHFEASAAIGIEVEIDAQTQDEAQAVAESMATSGKLPLASIVWDMLRPSEQAIQGYAEASGHPITFVTVEEDDEGFEVVDCYAAPVVEEGRANG